MNPLSCWSFEPDLVHAAALSSEIHRRFIDSVEYVFGEVGDELGLDRSRADEWIASLRSAERALPIGHALFHSIVAEVGEGDFSAAGALAARLLTVPAAGEGLSLYPLQQAGESDHPLALFSRYADLEEENRLELVPPHPEVVTSFERLFDEGWRLIVEHDRPLEGEFRALVLEILVAGQAPSHLFTTAAVSCFQNWGGLIVNATVAHDPLDIVELVAHEATHLLLFAVALDEPLLTNPPEEKHYSPLRDDARSMDGVYHATVVAARIARAMLRQAQGDADPRTRQVALARAARARQLFSDGLVVVEQGARLTRSGRAILDDCKTFMARLDEMAWSRAAPLQQR